MKHLQNGAPELCVLNYTVGSKVCRAGGWQRGGFCKGLELVQGGSGTNRAGVV